MTRLIFLGCIAYLVVGLGQMVVGSVMEPMVHAYGIEYGDGGQLVMNQFLGGLFGIICAPWCMQRFGKKTVLLTALVFLSAAELLYTFLPPWGIMLTIAPIAGIGCGLTESVVGYFIISASGERANTAMSRVEIFFGVGALLIPFAGSALIEAGYWKFSFGIVGILATATVILWGLCWPNILDQPAQLPPKDKEETKHKLSGPPKSRTIMILTACTLFFAVYVGLEMSYVHYLPSLLVKDNGLDESTATLTISLFWAAMVIGRMFAGQIADRIGGSSYLFATCLITGVLFILMTILTGVVPILILTFLAGLSMSGMFAIALVFANRAAPGRAERTTSLLMASGVVGGALLPKGTGWLIDQQGPEAARWLFAAAAVVLLVAILWAAAAARRRTVKTVELGM
ncbi:MFS transporter [Paenibacillus baekrokdamisoli]|uniref:MFS transporter n=1 Tax=Paenibacillus baekrokdamisoli TaxID=1712516 RepID=A0A3G9IWA5_9BACL|nr:MFS transporter [Paenibacillus baekrokdamisoli]BBH23187.1 MFS transporter [Paenibacillus baekrokdamisoli]